MNTTITLSTDYVKKQAQVLRDFLKKNAINLKPNVALDIISKCYGFPNWNNMTAKLNVANEGHVQDKSDPMPGKFIQEAIDNKNPPLFLNTFDDFDDDANDVIDGVLTPTDREFWSYLNKKFNSAVNKYESGTYTLRDFIADCIPILVDSQYHYLDVYAHVGAYFYEAGMIKAATSWYEAGAVIGRIIVNLHKGTIDYGSLDNRPFLRCHHGLLLCYIQADKITQACEMAEEHLRWNPRDNIGIRGIAGELFMRAGKKTKARKYLNYGKDMGNNLYLLGLTEFRDGKFVKAVTALRKAFIDNMYVAEILLGNTNPSQRLFWHGMNTMEVPWAQSEIATPGFLNLWHETPGALRFLDWAYHSSLALEDRMKLTKHHENLTATKVGDPERISATHAVDRHSINDKTSQTIVRKYYNSYERENWPWEEDALSEKPWRKGEEPEQFRNS